MYYSVDALENGTARLVDDAGGSAFVPAADLPSRCGAGGCAGAQGRRMECRAGGNKAAQSARRTAFAADIGA